MIPTFDEIRKILVQDWDPIGVGDTTEGFDEYESYIGTVRKLSAEIDPKAEIKKYLCSVEIELGLSPNRARAERVAQKLIGF